MFANKWLVPHTSLEHGLSMLVPTKFCKALYIGKEDYTMSKRMQDMQGKLHIYSHTSDTLTAAYGPLKGIC